MNETIHKFENLCIRALQDYSSQKSSIEGIRIGKNSLQTIINNYCIDQGEQSINWKETGIPNLSVLLTYLETRSHVELSPCKTEIISIKSIEKVSPKRNSKKKVTIEKINPKQTHSAPPSRRTKKMRPTGENQEVSLQKLKSEDLASMIPSSSVCPVCNRTLENVNSQKLNTHIDECLNLSAINQEKVENWEKNDFPCSELPSGTKPTCPSPWNTKYLAQTLKTAIPNSECPICFEHFEGGNTIARLECLCIFHSHCIEKWFNKSKSCPFHPTKL